MLENDLTSLWYDDNWNCGKYDVYSYHRICSPVSNAGEIYFAKAFFLTLKIPIP